MVVSEIAVATDRMVITYSDPWPSGFLTGYEDEGGWVVEWLVALRPGVLLPMLAMGLEIARTRGYAHLRARLPKAFPRTPKLLTLARRCGFRVYHEDDEWIDCVTYL